MLCYAVATQVGSDNNLLCTTVLGIVSKVHTKMILLSIAVPNYFHIWFTYLSAAELAAKLKINFKSSKTQFFN